MFFFKQKTAYEVRISDWSSDVCSSDRVHEARGDQRRRLGDAAADLRNDAPGDIQHVLVVLEADAGQFQLATALDVDLLGAVDHDVGHQLVGQQGLEGAEAEHVVEHDVDDRLLLRRAQVQLLVEGDPSQASTGRPGGVS